METMTRSDRQATWEEVCEALSLSSRNSLEFGGAPHVTPPGADFSQPIGLFAEEVRWLALAREAQDSSRN